MLRLYIGNRRDSIRLVVEADALQDAELLLIEEDDEEEAEDEEEDDEEETVLFVLLPLLNVEF